LVGIAPRSEVNREKPAFALNLLPGRAETGSHGFSRGGGCGKEADMWQRLTINRWSVRAITLLAYVAVAGAGKKWR